MSDYLRRCSGPRRAEPRRPGYIRSGASTPSRSSPVLHGGRGRAAEVDPEGGELVRLAHHAAAVVEAVEGRGELDQVGRRPGAARGAPRPPRARPASRRARITSARSDGSSSAGRRRLADRRARGTWARMLQHPRVRVLHVVDRVLLALLAGQVEVEVERRLVAALHQEEARGVHADVVEQVAERHDGARPLAHLLGLAPLEQADELDDRHLERVRVVPAGREHGAQARDVAVVVGAEHVDQQVVAAPGLVEVVGDVGGEVGGVAVAADQHAVLVVAVGGGAEPDRALGLVGVAGPRAGRRCPSVDVAAVVQGRARRTSRRSDTRKRSRSPAIAASIRRSPRSVRSSMAASVGSAAPGISASPTSSRTASAIATT